MEENAKARDLEEQAVITRQGRELSYEHRREDWPDQLPEGYEPARGEFDLPQGKVPGHRCDGWRRMTGDEGYSAACSCGWRSTETGHVSLVLRQIEDHLDAGRAVRGGRPSVRVVQAPGQDECEVGLSERRPDERTRELYASVESQHEWRNGIVAAAEALAAIAQEVALAGQDLEPCYRSRSAEYRRPPGEPANRHGGREVMAG